MDRQAVRSQFDVGSFIPRRTTRCDPCTYAREQCVNHSEFLNLLLRDYMVAFSEAFAVWVTELLDNDIVEERSRIIPSSLHTRSRHSRPSQTIGMSP
jgi:hypothetical protein